MPKQKSWLEIELAEKRELLEAFYNERILKLNQRSIDGFKEFLIHIHFPKDPTWQEKIENLFSDAISKKINFEQFFDALKSLPFMLIRGMGNHEKFTKSVLKKPTVEPAEIDPTDLIKIQEKIKQYIADKNITASVSFGSAEGTLLTNLQDNKSYSYAIHSVGKVFTGMLVMLMMIKGMISDTDLKEPIKLNDSIKIPDAIRKQLEKVSLHQVMTHKAALGDYLENYCAAISQGKIPLMKNVEDFLQFAEDSFYLNAAVVTPEKMAHCFPLKRKINIFQTLEEAKIFVNGIEDYDKHFDKEFSYPIFSINLKGDIQSRLIHDSHREKPCDSSFMYYSYSEVDIRNVTNVFTEVWFDEKEIILDRKIAVKENSKGLFLVYEMPKNDAEISSGNCCLI